MTMTPERLAQCLETLRWTNRDLARALGRSETIVRRWHSGAVIPGAVQNWLETLTEIHTVHQPPTLR